MKKESKISWEKTVEWAFVKQYLNVTEFAAPLDGNQEASDAFLSKDHRWFLIEFKHACQDLISEEEKYPSTSLKRAKSILRRLGVEKTDLDSLKDDRPWWMECLQLEKKKQAKNNLPCVEGGRVNPVISCLAEAKKAYEILYRAYSNSPSSVIEKTEPHFFIYSKDNDFKNLKMLPYWGTWKKDFSRSFSESAVDDMWKYGEKFPDFSEYVKSVATSRGYSEDWLGGGGDGSVFQQVIGMVNDQTECVVMSLQDFLEYIRTPPMPQANTSNTVIKSISPG